MKDIKKDPFEEYIKNLPPTRREMGKAWSAAIGLQNIDGEITIDEVDELINTYYETKGDRAEHSWYFRNALVRTNYNNITKGIYETTEYLEKFLRNLLQGKRICSITGKCM